MNVKEDMLKKKKEINEKTEIFIFVFLAFILLTIWAMTQPFNSGPDEQMRYYVADYIFDDELVLLLEEVPLKFPQFLL